MAEDKAPDLVARLTIQRNGLLSLLDDIRAEQLAQTRVELDRERAVSVGLLPRTYTIVGKNRTDVQRDALATAGSTKLADDQVRARFGALIEERNQRLARGSN